MRMVMTMQMETEAANRAIADGSLATVMDSMMERVNPEAVYYTTRDGMRTAYVFFELNEPAQMMDVAEPLFVGLKAKIDFAPAMTPDDVRQGMSRLSKR
ncbi:hypothetical protein Ais01nite_62620 [Asanoa ishikariensis]|uniref:Muconolactone delta-isomerase n=1 Tax=Asanoa ishikariensis TaxID=137265 RepID=A0A1H3NZJ3_9ACTN|nr:hypothetical protein [Asanoa ishikariensis]GIF68227.1 hypothetical protein Ais01nite_62620 [Asanoa ishikariensis]SDY94306.1 hypothetical protein SAMN05421684_2465 [Asanoa ishikariensis]